MVEQRSHKPWDAGSSPASPIQEGKRTMLRRLKERIQHDVKKQLILNYVLIAIALSLGYLAGLLFGFEIGWIVLGIGTVFIFIWLVWITSY